MKKILLLFIATLLLTSGILYGADETFNATITIRQAIVITETKALEFGDVISSNVDQSIVVSVDSPGAARFDIVGEAITVTWDVVEANIQMIDTGGNSIVVDTFTVTGGGTGILPQTNVGVGGVAHVNANQPSGDYVGTATFSVLYN
ncbi:MAG: DUF4402 domain-containing protein [Desulfobacterales bacterium]|nr:DUF4402 domain-containing protein [Desulfobacterales bacterium]